MRLRFAGPTRRPVRRPTRHPALAAVATAVALAASALPALATTTASVSLARATWTIAPESRAQVVAQAADRATPWSAAPDETTLPAVKRGPSPVMAALRSLAVPGWGQLATGHKMQAASFLGLEAASWGAFLTYQRQGRLRRDSYFETAQFYAGIDLENQDERIRRLVGLYQSNEVFNQYVVRREAAFFIEDPAEQEAFIAAQSLGGAESWEWMEFDDFLRYREQRRSSEAAFHNSEFVVGFAIANRLVSAVMAARQAAALRKRAAAGSSTLEAPAPQPGQPNGRFAWGVAPSVGGPLEGRVGWTVTF
ncbi:MAG: hypothetical protein ABIP29_04095 [Candidatus Eisenbacteria bacterium]